MPSFDLNSGYQVKYGDVEVNNGTVLTPTQVKNQPHLAWLAEAGAFYTVCMTGGCLNVSVPLLDIHSNNNHSGNIQ